MSDSDPADRFTRAKEQFFEGLGHFEAGRFEAALQCLRDSLELVPGRVSTLVNLAATQLKLWRPQHALTVADQVLAVEPDNLDAWFHRGTALGQLERHAEALASFDKALALDAGLAEPWLRHAETLQSLNRHDEALLSYERALAIDPQLAVAWSNRGGILRESMRLDEAAEAFRRAIACGADPELNGYFLAAVGGQPTPPASPPNYVEPLFDDYAAGFDNHLVRVLRYCGHVVLVEELAGLGRRRYRSALDLGCGTGLCGPLLRPLVDRLTGVDLSNAMLRQARSLGVYDLLLHADIVDALRQLPHQSGQTHDLILAADVFIYIGDLAPVFAAAQAALNVAGVFCFSAEIASREDRDFELLPSLRYAHAQRYLQRLASEHGFDVARMLRRTFREDQRQPVDGLFVYLTKEAERG